MKFYSPYEYFIRHKQYDMIEIYMREYPEHCSEFGVLDAMIDYLREPEIFDHYFDKFKNELSTSELSDLLASAIYDRKLDFALKILSVGPDLTYFDMEEVDDKIHQLSNEPENVALVVNIMIDCGLMVYDFTAPNFISCPIEVLDRVFTYVEFDENMYYECIAAFFKIYVGNFHTSKTNCLLIGKENIYYLRDRYLGPEYETDIDRIPLNRHVADSFRKEFISHMFP